MSRVLLPLPQVDFDPTEVAVPWRVLTAAGVQVVFATPQGGAAATCDPLVLVGPVLGKLGARPENVALCHELEQDPAFRAPLSYERVDPADFDGLVLPGGHAPGMKPYLESVALQEHVRSFWATRKPVGAICHGTIVLARTRNGSGESVVAGRRMTCLPRWMELSAWALSAWKLGRYYRTYDQTVQAEVQDALSPTGRLMVGPLSNRYDRPFVVRDELLVTARWPGDAQAFAEGYLGVLREPRA